MGIWEKGFGRGRGFGEIILPKGREWGSFYAKKLPVVRFKINDTYCKKCIYTALLYYFRLALSRLFCNNLEITLLPYFEVQMNKNVGMKIGYITYMYNTYKKVHWSNFDISEKEFLNEEPN